MIVIILSVIALILSLIGIGSSIALWFMYLGLTGMMNDNHNGLIECWNALKDLAEGMMKGMSRDHLTDSLYAKLSGKRGH